MFLAIPKLIAKANLIMHTIQELLSLLVSFFLCTSFIAQPPEGKIETDRPDQTESPFIVPRNYFQFEFGLNMEKDKLQGVNTTTFVLPTGLLKYGIKENVEFRLEFQSFTSRRRNDLIKKTSLLLEPVELGFKARLWEEKGALPIDGKWAGYFEVFGFNKQRKNTTALY